MFGSCSGSVERNRGCSCRVRPGELGGSFADQIRTEPIGHPRRESGSGQLCRVQQSGSQRTT